ncbi:hypothetical protein BGW38_006982, partial [Lunasporangiospora selenospora]
MFHGNGFISFHDLNPEATLLWLSPSVVDCLGFEAEELVGLPGYSIIYEQDVQSVKSTHFEHLMNDMAATQMVVRYRTKDRGPCQAQCVFTVCYDFIVNYASVIDRDSSEFRLTSAHSAIMTQRVGSKKEEFARMKKHHAAFAANSWDPNSLQTEVRVCLILNRFTRNSVIMYASSAAQLLFNMDPEEMIGIPFLVFIRSDDLASFVDQVDLAKSSNIITHMRFWLQSPNSPNETPCEAMLFGASDGMLVVMRKSRPFYRRKLLAALPEESNGYTVRQRSIISESTRRDVFGRANVYLDHLPEPKRHQDQDCSMETDTHYGSLHEDLGSGVEGGRDSGCRLSHLSSETLSTMSPLSSISTSPRTPFLGSSPTVTSPHLVEKQEQSTTPGSSPYLQPSPQSTRSRSSPYTSEFQKTAPALREIAIGTIHDIKESAGDRFRPLQQVNSTLPVPRMVSHDRQDTTGSSGGSGDNPMLVRRI